jgi:RNA polymerase sigma factor (sigma-70 family)
MEETTSRAGSIESQFLQIKQGDEHFLKELYQTKRIGFIKWFQKNYQLDKQQALDLFQKAFTAFYFNVKDEKIVTLRSTIDTYLFGIGKVLMKEHFRQEKRIASLEEIPEMQLADYGIFESEETSHQQNLVRQILNELEDPCKTLLELYYFKKLSLETIAIQLGYKNQGVAKKKKCLCLKAIREQLVLKKIER